MPSTKIAQHYKKSSVPAVRVEIRARENEKRLRLQAELDALKPKTAALKRYQVRYLDRVKGAMMGSNLGGLGSFAPGNG